MTEMNYGRQEKGRASFVSFLAPGLDRTLLGRSSYCLGSLDLSPSSPFSQTTAVAIPVFESLRRQMREY